MAPDPVSRAAIEHGIYFYSVYQLLEIAAESFPAAPALAVDVASVTFGTWPVKEAGNAVTFAHSICCPRTSER